MIVELIFVKTSKSYQTLHLSLILDKNFLLQHRSQINKILYEVPI